MGLHEDLPAAGMYEGRSAGSAQPLVWAHAEYIKLLRSVTDGKIFDHHPRRRRRATPSLRASAPSANDHSKSSSSEPSHQLSEVPAGFTSAHHRISRPLPRRLHRRRLGHKRFSTVDSPTHRRLPRLRSPISLRLRGLLLTRHQHASLFIGWHWQQPPSIRAGALARPQRRPSPSLRTPRPPSPAAKPSRIS